MPAPDLQARGAHTMTVCNSCRYCEQYCPVFPAMERRLTFAAGDLVFMGVGASHGFTNTGSVPVRWIEAQAPIPPASDGFFFHEDWRKLEAEPQ